MRHDFHSKLDELTTTLGDMCSDAGILMERATGSLLRADLELAEWCIEEHAKLVDAQVQAESKAFLLLALQGPVARDLRTVVGTLQNVADAERMGGLAVHIARIARRRHPHVAVPEPVVGMFFEMGRIAVDLGAAAAEVVRSCDHARAAEIEADDDAMDALHQQLFTVLLDGCWQHGVVAAVDITLLGRFYERFADHAVTIGRRVIFEATGQPTDTSVS